MLTRLIPEQAAKFWDIIKYSVSQAGSPIMNVDEGYLNRILMNLISGYLNAWILYERNDESIEVIGVVITRIVSDDIEQCKSLLIYSIFGYKELSDQVWVDGLNVLAKFASANHCSNLISYSKAAGIIRKLIALGWESGDMMLKYKVDGGR